MRCKRLFVVAAVALISIFWAGCGGSNNNPTPQGGFTNGNLNGTFAMSFSGSDVNGFFAVAGMVTVDGNGHVTSGVLDLNEAPTPITNASLTGTYAVRADGRGVMGLTGSAGNFNLVFVLVANNRALVTRFEKSAVGSGSLDPVNSSAFSTAALAGTFVFNLSGIDTVGNPLTTVGSITTNSTGTVSSGVQDQSDNGAIVTDNPITSGSIQVASNGRGTASITTAAGPQNFAFYVVDANHIKLVETDSLPAIAGDAFRQGGAISAASLSGPFAFTVAGSDVGVQGAFASGGVFSSNGSGTITSGIEDFNDAGSPVQNVALAGTYSIDASGRGTATITTATVGTLTFAFYPTTNGVQLMETDTGLVVSGAAFPQTGALSTSTFQGMYGLNYTAATGNGEVDTIASVNANSAGHFTAIMDVSNFGAQPSSGTALSGSYTIDATGHGSLTLQSAFLGQQNMAIYAISNSRALFVELDTDIVAAGDIEHQ